MNNDLHLFRGRLACMTGDPDLVGSKALQYHEQGYLAVENGCVADTGPAEAMADRFPGDLPVVDFGHRLILPGFVDAHVHSSQIRIVASYGEKLLEWLGRYAFPEEERHADPEYARMTAELFIGELLRNGTTTANVFTTVHPHTSDLLFEAALEQNMRMIAGKVLMDRNAPPKLLDSRGGGFTESAELIRKWHGKGRLGYAVIPRFAVTSTPAQLLEAARLLREFDGVWLHTHLSENQAELAMVRQLYPDYRNYWDVYEEHQLAGPSSVFAHGIHLDDSELKRIGATGSGIAHCPSSNLFLGSGLFRLHKACEHRIRVGIGSDVGAGTSLSVLANLGEAYKVARLTDSPLTPEKAFYLATLGGADLLGLASHVGTFMPGHEADFVVIDPLACPLIAEKTVSGGDFGDLFFPLMVLGSDRVVHSSWIMGECRYRNPSCL